MKKIIPYLSENISLIVSEKSVDNLVLYVFSYLSQFKDT